MANPESNKPHRETKMEVQQVCKESYIESGNNNPSR